jgi:crotonobetainyl-CoA:carnitine CoA-transferase CaiB-like acyl-CoA transferase
MGSAGESCRNRTTITGCDQRRIEPAAQTEVQAHRGRSGRLRDGDAEAGGAPWNADSGTAGMTGTENDKDAGRNLASLTIVDFSGTPAPSFAGSLFADFGAFVVVVEPPGGSPLRALGPPAVQDVWWPIAARNKFSLALDVANPQSAPVMAKLVASADIVLRDDTTPQWKMQSAAARAVDVRIHAPGADRRDLWSGSIDPRFAAAATGAMALTGDRGAPPYQAEFPLADYCAGMLAATSALIELRAARAAQRPPAPIAIGTHEALLRMNEWQLVFATARGFAEQRNGNRFPLNVNIGNIFLTRDSKLITLSAATAAVASRLLALIGGEALRDDPRFSTPAARRENMDALELIVADWISQYDIADVLRMGREADVVIGPIMDAGDIMAHPQVAALSDVLRIPLEDGSPLAMPGIFPRINGIEAEIRRAGPAVGADSDRVLARFGFSEKEIGELRLAGVVWA